MSKDIEIVKNIMTLLQQQEIRIESENLGYYQSDSTKVELDLIKKAKELLNKGEWIDE